jgi:hypothetical protein
MTTSFPHVEPTGFPAAVSPNLNEIVVTWPTSVEGALDRLQAAFD